MEAKIHIMIVDDELIVREALLHWFERYGHAVDAASSGFEALEKLEKEPFDLLFVDIKMPGMDGLQTLKKIKELHPKVKVIMVTAVETQEKIEEAMRLGADNYITKPLSLEYLEKDVQDKIDILAKNA